MQSVRDIEEECWGCHEYCGLACRD